MGLLHKSFRLLLLGGFLTLLSFSTVAQQNSSEFLAHPKQRFGFDDPKSAPPGTSYRSVLRNDSLITPKVKSVWDNETDRVLFRQSTTETINSYTFYINDTLWNPVWAAFNDTLTELTLPARTENYFLEARLEDYSAAVLKVNVFSPLEHHLILVSLSPEMPDKFELERYLDSVYQQAGIQFLVINTVYFEDSLYGNTTFSNPSRNHDLFTTQMRQLRDGFFLEYPTADRESHYLFFVPGFTDPSVKGYSVPNKAMLFFSLENKDGMHRAVAHELGRSIGMLKDLEEDGVLTENLMDEGAGTHLTEFQWYQLRHSSNSFSYYDADEDLVTNNGMVAYYFWEEDENGNIKIEGNSIFNSIKRPYKKNYLSYHLNIRDLLFEIVFEIEGFPIVLWHIIVWTILLALFLFTRWRFKHRWRSNPIDVIKGRIVRVVVLMITVFTGYIVYEIVLRQLDNYVVKEGEIEEFAGLSYSRVNEDVLHNGELKHKNEYERSSEILIKIGDKWMMKRRKSVLYFDAVIDSSGNLKTLRFALDHDSLILHNENFRAKAHSHYMIINYRDQNDSLLYQKLHNHIGLDITDKVSATDPAKTILVFVNGYRPTSTGHSFEENFKDLKSNGLEYPNSTNMIFTFDRYDYWQPWKAIDDHFIARINPTEVYYADGHFSVSTSNHRSLFNFTKLSASYPKRCKNPKKHTCEELKINTNSLFGRGTSPTIDLLPTSPNKRGFQERRTYGEIAGANLYSILNEIPNRSKNDTIYIVAHSMGYAYSLGMIDQLRSWIQFGGFYIIAPENAESGAVNPNEWKEVWQYGSKLTDNVTAACLQDGIAPQSCASGLTEKNRIYIPLSEYKHQGFFDSHFIGYYTWVFDLKPGQKGYIRQR